MNTCLQHAEFDIYTFHDLKAYMFILTFVIFTSSSESRCLTSTWGLHDTV